MKVSLEQMTSRKLLADERAGNTDLGRSHCAWMEEGR